MYARLLLALFACDPAPPPPTPPVVVNDTAPAPICGEPVRDAVVLDLSGGDLAMDVGGKAHGGRMLSEGRRIRSRAPIEPGEYRIEVWGHTTRFDGSPGVVSVRIDEVEVAQVKVPEGASQLSSATFRTEVARWAPVELVFVNDAYEKDGADRNVEVGRLRLTRLSAAIEPSERKRALLEATAGANLVLVSIDTLRADHLSAYGYGRDTSPRLDALAAAGVRFTNAVSASHWTAPSHASMLTGLHPREHGVIDFPAPRALGDEVDTLAEHLAAADYQSLALPGGTYVSAKIGLMQGFDDVIEGAPGAERKFATAMNRLDGFDAERPFFLFVHTFEVHEPYDPPAPWDRMYDPEFVEDKAAILRKPLSESFLAGRLPTTRELHFQTALYDGGIRYTDHHLGKLVDRLGGKGVDANTLVVVTSDHGEQFLEHGGMGHGALFAENIRVPLVMSHPALQVWGRPLVHETAPAVDLLPTLLELLGQPVPDGLSGRSSVDAMVGLRCDPGAAAYSSATVRGTERTSVLDAAGHYIVDDGEPHFFRPDVDRAERVDIAGSADVSPWADRLDTWWTGLRLRAPTTETELTDAERKQLRALGYLE